MFRAALAIVTVFAGAAALGAATPAFPLPSGQYHFRVADAEFDGRISWPALVTIKGTHIKVVVTGCNSAFGCNAVYAEGEIYWHKSGQWIIASSQEDIDADDVGGCSGGPTVVDPEKKIVWHC